MTGQEPETAGPPAGVPQVVFGVSPEAARAIVACNRAALGLPPQETAGTTAGQAAQLDVLLSDWRKLLADLESRPTPAGQCARTALSIERQVMRVNISQLEAAIAAQQPQPAPGGSHIGRSWQGHGIEDECPCPKAPCGLVVQETVSEACDQHPLSAGRTIRQGHRADQCPAVPAAEQPAPELAAAKRAIAEYERLARTGTIPDAGRRAEIRAGLETP